WVLGRRGHDAATVIERQGERARPGTPWWAARPRGAGRSRRAAA
ncbi:MAG: hypothetical protein AVDCRST_MAG11-713, partial [uncultured Gemmatimonadaceae bacterium]